MSGESKYPSRFLFEIKENLLIHKGEMKPLYLNEAKNHFAFEKQKLEENVTNFNLGDVIRHPVWNEGQIINIDFVKGEYEIQFTDTKTRPINFEYKFLEVVNTTDVSAEKQAIQNDKNVSISESKYINEVHLTGMKDDSDEKSNYESHKNEVVEVEVYPEYNYIETLNCFNEAAKIFVQKQSINSQSNHMLTNEDNEETNNIDLIPEDITEYNNETTEFANLEPQILEYQSENYVTGEIQSFSDSPAISESFLTENIEANQIENLEIRVEPVVREEIKKEIHTTEIQNEAKNELKIKKLSILERLRQFIRF